jgi:hypothetical protein
MAVPPYPALPDSSRYFVEADRDATKAQSAQRKSLGGSAFDRCWTQARKRSRACPTISVWTVSFASGRGSGERVACGNL